MRHEFSNKLEVARVRNFSSFVSGTGDQEGLFMIAGPCGCDLKIVSSGASNPVANGWEHVSISTKRRPPNWQEMCFVKDLFWEPEEAVVQFHPPESEYVNNHLYCLHLWKPPYPVILPPSIMVGVKDAGVIRGPADAVRVMVRARG